MESSTDPITDVAVEASRDVEAAVMRQYAEGAERVEVDLGCPTNSYDAKDLRLLRQQILDKDYGCGDASRDVRPGETVVDVGSIEDISEFEAFCVRLRQGGPLIADASVDVVVSNCVLNCVRTADKRRLIGEIHRVFRYGGSYHIADFDPLEHRRRRIATGEHCFASTAGCGSTCTGSPA